LGQVIDLKWKIAIPVYKIFVMMPCGSPALENTYIKIIDWGGTKMQGTI
jgi:hypothetical protein